MIPSASLKLSPEVIDALAFGAEVYDHEVDQILPAQMREISDVQWSSVKVAKIIAGIVRVKPRARFIDLGCGVGKLCLLLSLMTDLQVFGIERRLKLVRLAERLLEANAPGEVKIIHGDILDLQWDDFDIFYLYNPFLEMKCNKASRNLIDHDIELGQVSFEKYIDGVDLRLKALKPGQSVITFHGYGGQMPDSLRVSKSFRCGNGTVKLWEQV